MLICVASALGICSVQCTLAHCNYRMYSIECISISVSRQLSVCLVDQISDTRSQGYTNLQSLVTCLDHAQLSVWLALSLAGLSVPSKLKRLKRTSRSYLDHSLCMVKL